MSETVTKKMMLFFPKCECEKPIIYHLVKDHNLVVNVFRAKVTPEEEGYLVLDVTGTEGDIERGMDFVKTFNVTISYTNKGVIRDKEKCTHCGLCVAYCPTRALCITNDATREVLYNEDDCIECLACIRICPFGACVSTF
jgi:ferredoxin